VLGTSWSITISERGKRKQALFLRSILVKREIQQKFEISLSKLHFIQFKTRGEKFVILFVSR